MKTSTVSERVATLIERGVAIPQPQLVSIDADVDLDNIAKDGVVLHPGCRIKGAQTVIMSGSQIGVEGPATVYDCQLGPQVSLASGYFRQCVLLKGASMGSGAHVRKGTILEEAASGAHTVGLKQTILFPHVTLGSLINFCDCLMAGGTGPKNHSEVGSSYIHFNFSPHQDKATASLIGDVPRGVMLDQVPIFLGGQGGMVGPCRIEYGTVLAAGSICRKDQLDGHMLVMETARRSGKMAFKPGRYNQIRRILECNIQYIGNLLALDQWYRQVRVRFINDPLAEKLHHGLVQRLESAISERIKRLDGLCDKIEAGMQALAPEEIQQADSGAIYHQRVLVEQRQELVETLQKLCDQPEEGTRNDHFLKTVDHHRTLAKNDYLKTIKDLPAETKALGTRWLESIVAKVQRQVAILLPALQGK